MAEQERPPQFEDFDARLDKLRQADKPAARGPRKEPERLNFGSGLQAGIEVVAGVAGGVLIGWGLDRWLGTQPLFLIVFFMLGAAAGVLNSWRFLRRMQGGTEGR
ncbi:MAG: AtpZ/AtpI family protein [Geminicoccaceae bacterium]